MTKTPSKQKIISIRQRILRGEPEGKIVSAEKVSEEQVWHIRNDYNDAATPETLSKVRRDPLKNLVSRGALDEYHLLAADRIRTAILLKRAGLGSKNASLECRIDIVGKRPTETESEWSVRMQQRHTLWMQLCAFEKPRVNTLVVEEILMEPVSFKEVDRDWGKREGWAKGHLVAGLDLYCNTFRPVKKST